MDRRRILAALFLLSGATALVYEIVWIRLFSISFGNTALALSTVLSVYLGGLALGSFLSARFFSTRPGRGLQFYGIAEALNGAYGLAIPALIAATQPLLASFYGSGQGNLAWIVLLRALLSSAILIPSTVLMGASLPLLAAWVSGSSASEGNDARPAGFVTTLYTINLAGASLGALLTGFALVPHAGFSKTLEIACAVNILVGSAAWWTGRSSSTPAAQATTPSPREVAESLPGPLTLTVAFVSGLSCMLYEVVWNRIYGLLVGPTTTTVTLILATFLIGLTLGGIIATRVKRSVALWLCASQFAASAFLAWALTGAALSPEWIAHWVRSSSGDPTQIEWMKMVLLAATLLPLCIAVGLSFPLLLRLSPERRNLAARVGGIYGINTLGCIVGSLGTGWILIPFLGTEKALLLGGLINVAVALAILHRIRPQWTYRAAGAAIAGLAIVIFAVPRWNMAAMTAGAYKYAPYYRSDADVNAGSLTFLKEGISATVSVRNEERSLVLSIDGKVDATDAGGDLLTEKLLAHLPLLLAKDPKRMCLIGLASGVTAGAALTHPIDALDVLEISRDVADASRLFNRVSGNPLEDLRTTLLLNDGRNHLSLTSSRYDVIVSEPSNPWIAGMNSLFTQDFFRIAKSRLNQGGLFAQWFHIYNMPEDDLKSLLRAFQDIFPSAILWQLNDGDVLLTGFAGEPPSAIAPLSDRARADLASVAVSDPSLLLNLYLMRGNDLRRFAGNAPFNTDDDPRLEYHGQRDLHAQTDLSTSRELAVFTREEPAPTPVADVQDHMTTAQLLAHAVMFERAESTRSAFRYYQLAYGRDSASMDAIAGMDRMARSDEELASVAAALHLDVASLSRRTEAAINQAHQNKTEAARFLFLENTLAHPGDTDAIFNYGLFCMEQKEFSCATEQFERAIATNRSYLPAYEALAESYLQRHDLANAAVWSRRILDLNPNHQVARQILTAIQSAPAR